MIKFYTDLTFDELGKHLADIGLSLCWDAQKEWISIGKIEFANPMLWFNPRTEEKDYTGTVKVKSINVGLFSEEQVYIALRLVNSFLLTDLEKRELD